MANGYSADDLLEFLAHAGERGLVPAATAQALAVACRSVFGILDARERSDLQSVDLQGLLKRFANKRAKDFNPSSLKEYGRRVERALGLFMRWREDPANFSVKTRSTAPARKKERSERAEPSLKGSRETAEFESPMVSRGGGYQSAFPVRPGTVVTISNVPPDLTAIEAERLAKFVRMLAAET